MRRVARRPVRPEARVLALRGDSTPTRPPASPIGVRDVPHPGVGSARAADRQPDHPDRRRPSRVLLPPLPRRDDGRPDPGCGTAADHDHPRRRPRRLFARMHGARNWRSPLSVSPITDDDADQIGQKPPKGRKTAYPPEARSDPPRCVAQVRRTPQAAARASLGRSTPSIAPALRTSTPARSYFATDATPGSCISATSASCEATSGRRSSGEPRISNHRT